MTADHPQKITFGEMRSSGVRDVLVYCRDHHCSHHDGTPDFEALRSQRRATRRCWWRST